MRITIKLIELAEKIKIVTKSAEFRRILIRFANSADFVISAIYARSAISNFVGTFQICRCTYNIKLEFLLRYFLNRYKDIIKLYIYIIIIAYYNNISLIKV